MVDQINRVAGVQNLPQSGSKAQGETKKTTGSESTSGFNTADEVSISNEAALLADVQERTQALRAQLESKQQATLGKAGAFEEFLA